MKSQGNRTQHTARWAAAAGAGLGAIGMLATSFGPASAASGDVVIALDGQVATGAPGQEITLTSRDVPSDLVGRTCDGSYSSSNNSSVHPDTRLIIASNGSSVTIDDVEAAAGGTRSTSGPLTLGQTITVSVVLGGDGIASLGESVVLDCPDVSATTVAATTTMPETSTTEVGSEVVVPTTMGTTTTSQVGAEGPVPTALGVRITQTPAVNAERLPTTGSNDATPVLLAAAGGMVLSGLGARRLSLRRATRGGAR